MPPQSPSGGGHRQLYRPAAALAQAMANLDLGLVHVHELLDQGDPPRAIEGNLIRAYMTNLASVPAEMGLELFAGIAAAGQLRLATTQDPGHDTPERLVAGVEAIRTRLSAGDSELQAWLQAAHAHCDDVAGGTVITSGVHLATLASTAQVALALAQRPHAERS